MNGPKPKWSRNPTTVRERGNPDSFHATRMDLMTDELPVVTSPFQKSAVTAISQRADFSRFVLLQGESWPNKYGKPGPFVVPWYDKSGTLHAHRIGCNKILQEVEA